MNPELCVGAVVVANGKLLMVERGRGVGIGLWSIPGGRVEWGETLPAAVQRELFEETGLSGQCQRFLGLVERTGADHHFVILDYLVDVGVDAEIVGIAGDDAAALQWVPLDDVATMPGVVDGLVDFLRETLVLPAG
jgi:8-oxo-dGTP diphosphatase